MKSRTLLLLVAVAAITAVTRLDAAETPGSVRNDNAPAGIAPWSAEMAWQWYKKRPWIVGFNFVPSTACNTTEFWGAETFDEPTIDRELGWGAKLGFNSCRVFVQYLVWKHDPDGLKKRMDRFLAIAGKRGVSTTFVLFDDCCMGSPPQTEPMHRMDGPSAGRQVGDGPAAAQAARGRLL